MKAVSFRTEFEDLLAAWPAPIVLKHLEGDTFMTLYQRPDFIEAHWQGHITASDVVTAAKVYLALLQRHTCSHKLLNDKTEVTGDWAEANDWMEFEWLPQVMRAGMRCMAHVYSGNMFSRLSARDLYLRVMPRLQMANFNNRANAIAWLTSRKPTQDSELTSP
ncbi:hypothetical protein [Pontibacter oryzae]|uniref:STAS/SEC14 domain-containing protein n=1 Tax=Pontibacter oryzae TaxID=2304593 RepID=A0A399SM33_9BACT|nr:hypothetical protein [Pontibacter oryzae]RIJ42845.1 hypothetical protein D1627_03075 [Pontibacter oryzae]